MNMKNEKITSVLSKAKTAFGQIGKIVIILTALVVGFISGELYHRANQKKDEKLPMDLKNVHGLKGTSVAINERNELLIIDRTTGTYEIYEDSIGKVILRLYASQMAVDAATK
jgi:hypothetical protein